jgi:hypothetical protein
MCRVKFIGIARDASETKLETVNGPGVMGENMGLGNSGLSKTCRGHTLAEECCGPNVFLKTTPHRLNAEPAMSSAEVPYWM